MKGFLKFILLATVRFVVLMVSGVGFTFVAYILSLFGIGRWFLSIINDGYVSEVITMYAHALSYGACILLANKIKAYRPFCALCIVGAVSAVYGIVSSIRYSEPVISFIIALVISIIFFANAKEWVEK